VVAASSSRICRHYWAWPTGAVLSARLNLGAKGPTNPIVEIFGDGWQDGPPGRASLPRSVDTYMGPPSRGPPALRVILSPSMMATRQEYVGPPRRRTSSCSGPNHSASLSLAALPAHPNPITTSALNRSDRSLSISYL
jgi:hypothetical protein